VAPDHDQLPFDQWESIHRIQFLLDHWVDIFETSSASGLGGDYDSIPLLPEIAHHPSVKELDRCLGELFLRDGLLHAHEKAYRVSVEWRVTEVMRPFKLPSGKKILRAQLERQRVVPPWVRRKRVAEADAWLDNAFDGEPFIPEPLWRGLTEPVRVA